jgi:5-methyltetrahydropteroyltriglutamate--homocysteine methyltransferase
VSRQLFRRIKAQRLLLEYDDARSGSFEPLRAVPDDKIAVLGLVTTKKPDLESMQELTGRIDEASQFISKDRLALSPQCGFASSVIGNRLSPYDQRQKLALVVDTVRSVWDAV